MDMAGLELCSSVSLPKSPLVHRRIRGFSHKYFLVDPYNDSRKQRDLWRPILQINKSLTSWSAGLKDRIAQAIE